MAAAPILTTKLFVPPIRTTVVPRPRLIEKIEAGLACPLILISAPAGFGKSTFLSEWIGPNPEQHPNGIQIAWLSLDTEDNDTGQIWQYVLIALQRLNLSRLSLETFQNMLQARTPLSTTYLLTELINALAASGEPIALVLDDYHLIQNQGVHDGIVFFVEHLPPHVHLILSTRSDPPLPLGRWRSRGQIAEIRTADLRFTPDEANEFLNQSMRLGLAAQNVSELENRTEGWVAGLQLAALSLRNQPPESTERLIRGFSGSDHFILDYLTDEVVKRQPEQIQRFLLSTSILDRLSAPLCTAVLGEEATPAHQVLEDLEHANLFIIPLDNERKWYRYHHLFADLLRTQLREYFPQSVADLHKRAAAWYEQAGFPFEAIHHALQAKDTLLAADVIERAVRSYATWSSGNIARLFEALQALPDGVIASRPWLRLYIANAFYGVGQLNEADRILAEMEPVIADQADQPENGQVYRYLLAYRAFYNAVRGNVNRAIEYADRSLPLLQNQEFAVQGLARKAKAWADYLRGEVRPAEALMSDAWEQGKKSGSLYAAIGTGCNLAEILTVEGKLNQAVLVCQEAIRMAEEGALIPAVGLAKMVLATILYERNQLEEAETCIQECIRLLQQGGITQFFGQSYALLAHIQQANGTRNAATANMELAYQIAAASRLERYLHLLEAERARLWLRQGEIDRAVGWAMGYAALEKSEYLREFEDLTLARVWIAAGTRERVTAILAPLMAAAESEGRSGRLIEALALNALAQPPHRQVDAHEKLTRALHLAAPEGYQRVFLDCGEPMAILLNSLPLQTSPLREYRDHLLASFERISTNRAILAERGRQDELVEKLSERELEILRLIAIGFPNAKIAQQLYLTENTVRAHASHIFGKLGVHNRTEATARARELGLI